MPLKCVCGWLQGGWHQHFPAQHDKDRAGPTIQVHGLDTHAYPRPRPCACMHAEAELLSTHLSNVPHFVQPWHLVPEGLICAIHRACTVATAGQPQRKTGTCSARWPVKGKAASQAASQRGRSQTGVQASGALCGKPRRLTLTVLSRPPSVHHNHRVRMQQQPQQKWLAAPPLVDRQQHKSACSRRAC